MKWRSKLVVGLVGGAVLASAGGVFAEEGKSMATVETKPASLSLGEAAPMADVKMKNVDGASVSIDDVKGAKGTLVIFSCNACPWAKAWETRIVSLGNEFAKKGVGVVVINSNDPTVNAEDGYETMQARAKDRGMRFPYVVDATSEVARAFGATRTPEAFLFDKDGKLVYHGTIDDNAKEPGHVKSRYLRSALSAVSSGKVPSPQETKSLGCGIKFRAKSSS
jgi:peroxiredoxin